jgi:NTP pyrophosphatase (non-canonical NTP hydrolase)
MQEQKMQQHEIQDAVAVLVRRCHGSAKAAGWHNDRRTGAPRSAEQNHELFPVRLMLIVSELAEAMEGHRKNLMDDKLPHRKMQEVELADALARICDLAGEMNYDLGGALAEKLAYNAQRADHKPEARAAAGGKAY